MPVARRSLAIDGLDRTLRGFVGLVVGTSVGMLAAEFLGTLLALVWSAPRVWALWAACGGGVATGVWCALRRRWPWFRPVASPRRRRCRSARFAHGWVDFVVRAALGICAGAVAGLLAATALLVWLAALDIDIDAGTMQLGTLTTLLLGFEGGAVLGLLWFAVDLPWLPGRRRPTGRIVRQQS